MDRRILFASGLVIVTVGCDRGELMLLPVTGTSPARFDASRAPDATPPADHTAPPVRDAGGPPPFGGGMTPFECTMDTQCGPRRPHCDVRIRRCVECLAQRDCPSPLVCDGLTARCAVSCQSYVDCQNTAQTRCDTNRHVCVGCLANDQCFGQAPFCEPTTGQCVECLNDNQCQPPWRFCVPGRNECVQCLGDQDCAQGQVCGNGRCVTH